jgi:hypothetical protein
VSTPVGAELGRAEIRLTRPAVVFLPNVVPCGPRMTSRRSTSISAALKYSVRLCGMPSSTMPTGGSKDLLLLLSVKPRTRGAAKKPAESMRAFGVSCNASRTSVTACS